MKKAIAMRCTKEQFEEIEPKLKDQELFMIGKFKKDWYLVSFEDGGITNGTVYFPENYEIHETWNEKVFLDACGIETEPEFVITKEQIIEIHKTAYPVVQKWIKQWFPEAFKEDKIELPKDYKGWCKTNRIEYELWLMYFESGELKYGFDSEGDWFTPLRTPKIYHGVYGKRLATPKEIQEALTKEAVKRGYEEAYCINCLEEGIKKTDFGFWTGLKDGGYWLGGCLIFKNGKWAEIIPTITKEDAEKQLNKKIID